MCMATQKIAHLSRFTSSNVLAWESYAAYAYTDTEVSFLGILVLAMDITMVKHKKYFPTGSATPQCHAVQVLHVHTEYLAI